MKRGAMENKRKLPMPGEYYRHFKGNLYEVLTVAAHTETEEKLVVYRALYGSHQDYARPVHMFLSEVDHEKYPEAGQRYRFEKVGDCIHGMEEAFGQEKDAPYRAGEESREQACRQGDDPERAVSAADRDAAVLIRFLNAEGLQEKLEVIRQNRTKIDQRFIDSAAMALDIVIREGDLDDRLRELCRNLQLMSQYESRRLR